MDAMTTSGQFRVDEVSPSYWRVRARRVYEQASQSDGRRVLVDRLWPRGLSKAKAHLDEWLKAVAPSDELRRWYGHQPGHPGHGLRRSPGLARPDAEDSTG